MNQELFERRYRDFWLSQGTILDKLERGAKDLEPNEMTIFPHHYRRLCKHLALARDRQFSATLVEELNQIVMRAHRQIYEKSKGSTFSFSQFLAFEFPGAVRREARLFWVSSLLFYGSLVATFTAIQQNPDLVYSFISPSQAAQYAEMYAEPLERSPAQDIGMFGFYIRNNVGIAFRTFASGLLLCIGSILIILFNGLSIGAVAAHITNAGHSEQFWNFVCGHAPFELTAIVLAGAAGMRMGLAILIPGNRTRGLALIETGKAVLPIVCGMGLMLVLAAFIEAFWSPRFLAAEIKYGVSGALWLLVAVYFLFAGRTRAT